MTWNVEVDGNFGPYMKCNPRLDRAPAYNGFQCGVWNWNDTTHAVKPAVDCRNCSRTWQTVGWEDRTHRSRHSSPLSAKLGGSWYSLIGDAECHGAQRPGPAQGCSWRAVSLVSIKNATCILTRVAQAARANQSACFATCPDHDVYPEAPSVSDPRLPPAPPRTMLTAMQLAPRRRRRCNASHAP